MSPRHPASGAGRAQPDDSIGAILLAGGRGTRMGGVDKPLLEVGGATLLAHALAAVRGAGASPVTIAGPRVPELDADDLSWVREDPPFGGPAAAVVAALRSENARTDPEWTILLACDLPRAPAAVAQLLRDLPLLPRDTEGLCLADPSSRPQWLTGVYRTAPLREAAARLPRGGADASMRALLDDLAIAVVAALDGAADDIDTWEDLKRFTDPHEPPKETP